MKIGLIGNIRGDAVCLSALLEHFRREDVDDVICAGDVVGDTRHVDACLSLLQEYDVPTVMGDKDRAVVHSESRIAPSLERARDRLSAENLSWLTDRPRTLETADGEMLVVHSHPLETHKGQKLYPQHFPRLRKFLIEGDYNCIVIAQLWESHLAEFQEGVILSPGAGTPDNVQEITWDDVSSSEQSTRLGQYAVVDTDDFSVKREILRYESGTLAQRPIETAAPDSIPQSAVFDAFADVEFMTQPL